MKMIKRLQILCVFYHQCVKRQIRKKNMSILDNRHTARLHRAFGKIVFLLLVFLFGTFRANATNLTKLRVYFDGWGDYSCDSSFHSIFYVGGMYSIKIQVLPDGKKLNEIEYTGISNWTSPDGVVITVGQSSSPEGPFQPSDVLRGLLHLEYYVDALQIEYDSIWQVMGRIPPLTMNVPTYCYSFNVPSDLVNSYLVVAAEWDHPLYGHLVAEKPDYAKIVSPCSEAAQQMVWSTQVYVATRQGKYQHALILADSFVDIGWNELNGLTQAMMTAWDAENYETAIRFLDINFQMNHTIAPFEGWTPDYQASKADSNLYQMNRTRLLELKEHQQNQNEER